MSVFVRTDLSGAETRRKRRQEHTGAQGAGLAHHATPLLDWDRIRSIPDLRDQLRPVIEDRQVVSAAAGVRDVASVKLVH